MLTNCMYTVLTVDTFCTQFQHFLYVLLVRDRRHAVELKHIGQRNQRLLRKLHPVVRFGIYQPFHSQWYRTRDPNPVGSRIHRNSSMDLKLECRRLVRVDRVVRMVRVVRCLVHRHKPHRSRPKGYRLSSRSFSFEMQQQQRPRPSS